MDLSEIRKLDKNELNTQISDLKLQINKARIELKSQKVTPESINSYRSSKKQLARLLTVLHEKDILKTIN